LSSRIWRVPSDKRNRGLISAKMVRDEKACGSRWASAKAKNNALIKPDTMTEAEKMKKSDKGSRKIGKRSIWGNNTKTTART